MNNIAKTVCFKFLIFIFILFSAFNASHVLASGSSVAVNSSWSLKLATYNVWGLPVISKFKEIRMPIIGEALKSRALDLAFMQEAWLQKGRDDIFSRSGFSYNHYFKATGYVGSGVYQLSKYPIIRTTFNQFLLCGRLERIWDGEPISGKGVGMSTINYNGIPISLFNTHTVARHDFATAATPEDRYSIDRLTNLFEIFRHIVENRDSDYFILGGDFNMRYMQNEYKFWKKLSNLNGIYLEEHDHSICTSCSNNTFNGGRFNGQVDYFFASPKLEIKNPIIDFTDKINTPDSKSINLSDHYGLVVDIGPTNNIQLKSTSTVVRRNVVESLSYLNYRLTSYLGNKDLTDRDIEGSKGNGYSEQFCVSCQVKAALKIVRLYEDALNINGPSNPESQKIAEKLESYFQLFD